MPGKEKRRFGSQREVPAWDDSGSDEEAGGGPEKEAVSTEVFTGKKRSASAVDRGGISSSSSSSSPRQRGPAGAEQAHQAELKRRRAKYARDADGSHSGLVAADAAHAKAKKKKRNRAGVARREKRERRTREKMLPKSRDPKLQAELRQQESQYDEAEQNAARAEVLHAEEVGVLEAEGEMEATYRFKQNEIKAAVDMLTARKIFDLSLPEYGPYCGVDYTKNGRHLLIGGARGHLAMIDAMTNALQTELHVRETVRDVAFLHDHTMFAVAQRKYCYIYDNKGVELHCLRHHIEPTRVEFLPFHFLMVTAGKTGYLKWQDTSTGQLVAEARSRLGACNVLRQNPYNAVVSAGHSNGTVTMWSPTMSTPLVKMLCHRGPVLAVAHDTAGRYMVTSGLDKQMKVWDIRMFKPVSQYYTSRPATSLDISQRDMLGVGFGAHVQIWKDALRTKAKSPYMRHSIPGNVIATGGLRFRPFEDALMLGHSKGLSSIVVPGSGEPNFDSFAANPFETNKQRRETTVHRLLDKLAPEMIQLDPSNIGRVDRASSEVLAEERKLAAEANAAASGRPPKKAKKKMRGRNKLGKRLKRKQYNIVTKDRMLRQEQLAERKREERDIAEGRLGKPNRSGGSGGRVEATSGRPDHGAALSIFGKKKNATRSRTSR